MEALVRSMVKFPVLALVNMDRPTKGASHDLVHQLSTWHCDKPQRHNHKLQPAHDAQKNARVTPFGAGFRRFLPVPAYPCP